MNAIDVVMLTKNSEHVLRECLESLYENVPVKRLIIVDGHSEDTTLDIIDAFSKKHGNIEIIAEAGSRARARQVGICRVETEWFMFVDSDVLLCKDWFTKAEKEIEDDVGAIWGLNVDVIPNVKSKLFMNTLGLIAKEAFNLRGGMHDTLIRSELVKDIQIPEKLHAFEDLYIVNWIKKKRFRVLIGDRIYCLHLRPSQDWSLKESLSLAALDLKCGLAYSRDFKYSLYYPFFGLYWLLQLANRTSTPSVLKRS